MGDSGGKTRCRRAAGGLRRAGTKEETGVSAGRWTSLGLYIPAPAIFTELIHLYLARDLEVGAASPDADEELDLKWLPLDQAISHVLKGDWNDGKTAMALWRAQ